MSGFAADRVHPSRDDGAARALSEVVGGPVGHRAGRGRPFAALGVLLALTALTFALGLVSKSSCATRDWQRDGAAGGTPYTHACVSTVPDAYTGNGLVELAWPWSSDGQTRLRYPVTAEPVAVGYWQYAVAWLTQARSGLPDVAERYDVPVATLAERSDVVAERQLFAGLNAVLLAALALLTTRALVGCRARRGWDAAVFALAPGLALAGFVSYDLIPVAAAAGAMLALSRRRLGTAGALLGVGAAAGVWPALLLVALVIVALGGRGARGAVAALERVLPALVAALGAFVVLQAPVYLAGRAAWGAAWDAALDRGPDQGSLWAVLDQTVGISSGLATGLSLVLLAAWTGAVALLVLTAPPRPGGVRVSQVGLLLVAGALAVGVAWEPPMSLWLLPLAALAHPRWRDVLVWQGCEVVAFAMTSWWQGGLLQPGGDGGAGFYWISVVVRVVGVLWLVVAVGRVVRAPWRDVVLRDEVAWDDVLAGDGDQETTTRSNLVVV